MIPDPHNSLLTYHERVFKSLKFKLMIDDKVDFLYKKWRLKTPSTYHTGDCVTRFYIFVMRVILGAICAVVLSRFFYPNASLPIIMAIGIGLVCAAYVMEYFHRRKKGPQGRADS